VDGERGEGDGEGTFGADAHLVLRVVFEEALHTTAWELELTMAC